MKNSKDERSALIGTLAYGLYWVDECLQASMEAAGWERMSRTRSMLMVNITAGINRPADLARSIGVSRQAIHQLIQGMKDDGILELVPDPSDRRAKIVQFDARADKMRDDATNIMKAIEKALSKRLGVAEFKALKTLLGRDWGPITAVKI